jgi:hypothetical protein
MASNGNKEISTQIKDFLKQIPNDWDLLADSFG